MTLLLIVAAWLISVSLVAGLCMAARAGDRLPQAPVHVHVGEGQAPLRTPVQAGEIVARARVGAPTGGADSGASLAYRDGLAA